MGLASADSGGGRGNQPQYAHEVNRGTAMQLSLPPAPVQVAQELIQQPITACHNRNQTRAE